MLKRCGLFLMGVLLVMSSCGDSKPPSFLSNPEISPNPNTSAPLVAFLECSTDEPSRVVLIVSDGKVEREIRLREDFATDHRLPVLGLVAGRAYSIRVRAVDLAGNWVEAESQLEYRTPSLPDDFPPIAVRASQPDRMEPGVTLLEVRRMRNKELYFFLAVNSRGEVIWYYRHKDSTRYLSILPNGNLLYLSNYNKAIEIRLTGEIVRQWHAAKHPNNGNPLDVSSESIPVNVETFHHEIIQVPSGNYMTLSTEMRTVNNFPKDPQNPKSQKVKANIIGDVVVEFQPDGKIVNQWNLLDLLDPNRYGYDSAGPYWDGKGYGHVQGGTKDRDHANSLRYDQSDDSIIVSARHQDAVVKFSRQTGNLVWILGPHAGWAERWQPFLLRPLGFLEWPSHQHDARITQDGSLSMFDNGNYRTWPPEPKAPAREAYSRAVEFKVDEQARTVEQVWAYGGPGPEAFFSSFQGGTEFLPITGNVLITDGGRTSTEQGEFARIAEAGRVAGRIVEVTHSESPEIVFELFVEDLSAEKPFKWCIYRSHRLPSLYFP